MDKIQLEIIGLSYSQTQSGAYALVLGEKDGPRRLPIIIGGFEAQSIAIELESMTPSRPLTHDLFKTFFEAFAVEVVEVIIYNLIEGIFYAKMVCKNGEELIEIDMRTSDAIALAVRFKCPVYTHEFILSSAGILLEDAQALADNKIEDIDSEEEFDAEGESLDLAKLSMDELNSMLQSAIETENYEEASRLKEMIDQKKS